MAAKVKYALNDRCTRSCSVHPDNLEFGDVVIEWFNEGKTLDFMSAESEKLGRKLSPAALSRHKAKHLDRIYESGQGGFQSVDHLAVLQKMISVGAKRADQWRIGPSDTLKAMDLYYKLTQGSAMEALWGALSAASAGATDEEMAEGGEFDAEADHGTYDVGSLSPAELESVGLDEE